MQRRIPTEYSPHLPPPDAWIFIPGKDEPLPTPIDERGLVDGDALCTLLKTTIDPGFSWRMTESFTHHHFYWERGDYPNQPDELVNPKEFRELWSNQTILPEIAHRWMHIVTRQPPVPPVETMRDSIDGYRIKNHLARSAQLSITLSECSYIPDEKRRHVIAHHLEKIETGLEAAKKIPEEFRLIDMDTLDPTSLDDLRELSSCLRKAVGRSNHTYAFSTT